MENPQKRGQTESAMEENHLSGTRIHIGVTDTETKRKENPGSLPKSSLFWRAGALRSRKAF